MAVRLLDTNVVSFFFKRHPLAASYRPHLVGHTKAVSFMTVGELEEWVRRSAWGPGRIAKMKKTIQTYLVFDSDFVLCEKWAEVRYLRRRQPIDVADAWIAATALVEGVELVTHNPTDFHGIPGLRIITESP